MIKGIEFGGLIADEAFDAEGIVGASAERGAQVVISQRPKRKSLLDIHRELYKWRHMIANFFTKPKESSG